MLNRLDRDTDFFLIKVGTVSLLCHKHDSSEIHWSYFHLGSLEGVMMTLPAFPVHSISIRGVTATKIQAIEI